MTTLNNWYNSKLANYEVNYIDTEAGFCSDRNMASGSNFNSSGIIYYAPYDRSRSDGEASLQCHADDILSKDNEKLQNPIGLVTIDEAMLTGMKSGTLNTGSYLYTGQNYWTMSPQCFTSSSAQVFVVRSDGNLVEFGVTSTLPDVRPVINLRNDAPITGSGTNNDPFKVSGA